MPPTAGGNSAGDTTLRMRNRGLARVTTAADPDGSREVRAKAVCAEWDNSGCRKSSTNRFTLSPFILTIFVLFSIFLESHARGNSATLQLSRIEYLGSTDEFRLADVDGDGQTEFISLSLGRRMFVTHKLARTTLFGPALYQANYDCQIQSITPLEIDTLPGSELAVVQRDVNGDSLWVEIICGFDKSVVLCKTQAVIGKDISDRGAVEGGGWDVGAAFCYAADLDGDGTKEIIAPVQVGFDLYPRGVYVYSYPSGKLRWALLLASNPGPVAFADADGNGSQEIYLKTWPTSNGAVVGDEVDTLAEAMCVDHNGSIVWRRPLGDRFGVQTSDIHVGDCDGDSTVEIYYTVLVRQEDFDQQIHVLEKHRAIDNKFLGQRSFDGDRIFNRIFSSDIDQDSHDELIVDGFIGILRPTDLKTEREGDFSGASIAMIADVDGDPGHTPEIILTHRDSLYVVDSSMNVLLEAHAETGDEFYAAAHFTGPAGNNYLAVVMQTGAPTRHNAVTIYEIKPALPGAAPEGPTGGRPSWYYIAVVSIVGLVVGFAAGLAATRIAHLKKSPRNPKTVQYEHLLTALANFDHGRMGGKNLDRLQFLFANLPGSQEKLDEIRPNIQAAVDAYHAFTSDQLGSMALYARRIKPIQPLLQQFNRSREKLDEMLGRLEVGKIGAADPNGLRSSLPETIGKIKEAVSQAKGFVQAQFSVDLLRAIPAFLLAMVTSLRERGVGFRSITTRGGVMRRVFVSDTLLMAVLEELLTNACDAMADAKRKELSLNIEFGADEAIITLSDTGHGLPDADQETLFRRGFSTKPQGGGYGLYQFRQEVERFGGRLRLYNNSDGPGATAELILKTVNRE